jgi:hypothetical protein
MRVALKEGTITGKGWFDPHLGLPVETRTRQEATMVVASQVPGDTSGGEAGKEIVITTTRGLILTLMETGMINPGDEPSADPAPSVP